MSDFREEEALGKAYDSQLLRRLMTYLRPYKWSVVFAVILTLLVGPLTVVGPRLFGYAVDKYIVPGVDQSIPWPAALRGVGLISLLSLAALLLNFAVQYLQVRMMQNVGQQTLYDLRKEIFERLQRLPMNFYDRSPVGRLVTRVTTDVDALNDLFAAGIAATAPLEIYSHDAMRDAPLNSWKNHSKRVRNANEASTRVLTGHLRRTKFIAIEPVQVTRGLNQDPPSCRSTIR